MLCRPYAESASHPRLAAVACRSQCLRPGPTDLDGNPRIVSGSADATDPDADGHNTCQEWRCGTCPTNALSVLRLVSASHDGMNVTVSWQSVAGLSHFLECSTNLSATPCFTPLAANLPGQAGTTTYTHTNAVGAGPCFYRVGVRD